MSVSQELVEWCGNIIIPQVYNMNHVQSLLTKMQTNFQDIQTAEWSARVKDFHTIAGLALLASDPTYIENSTIPPTNDQRRALSELSRHFPDSRDRSDLWTEVWAAVNEGISIQLTDLRSAVIRECCLLIQALAHWLPPHFLDRIADPLFQALLKVLTGTVHVIVVAAEASTLMLVSVWRLSRQALALIASTLTARATSANTRRICCQIVLVSLLAHGGGGALERVAPQVESLLRERASDKDPTVRTIARQACKAYMAVLPQRATTLEKLLDAAALKALASVGMPDLADAMIAGGTSTRTGASGIAPARSRPSTASSIGRTSFSSTTSTASTASFASSTAPSLTTTTRPSTRDAIANMRAQMRKSKSAGPPELSIPASPPDALVLVSPAGTFSDGSFAGYTADELASPLHKLHTDTLPTDAGTQPFERAMSEQPAPNRALPRRVPAATAGGPRSVTGTKPPRSTGSASGFTQATASASASAPVAHPSIGMHTRLSSTAPAALLPVVSSVHTDDSSSMYNDGYGHAHDAAADEVVTDATQSQPERSGPNGPRYGQAYGSAAAANTGPPRAAPSPVAGPRSGGSTSAPTSTHASYSSAAALSRSAAPPPTGVARGIVGGRASASMPQLASSASSASLSGSAPVQRAGVTRESAASSAGVTSGSALPMGMASGSRARASASGRVYDDDGNLIEQQGHVPTHSTYTSAGSSAQPSGSSTGYSAANEPPVRPVATGIATGSVSHMGFSAIARTLPPNNAAAAVRYPTSGTVGHSTVGVGVATGTAPAPTTGSYHGLALGTATGGAKGPGVHASARAIVGFTSPVSAAVTSLTPSHAHTASPAAQPATPHASSAPAVTPQSSTAAANVAAAALTANSYPQRRDLTSLLTQCAGMAKSTGVSTDARLFPWTGTLKLLESVAKPVHASVFGTSCPSRVWALSMQCGPKTLLKFAHLCKNQLKSEQNVKVAEAILSALAVLCSAVAADAEEGHAWGLDKTSEGMLVHALVETVAALTTCFAHARGSVRRTATDIVNSLTGAMDELVLMRVCTAVLCDEVVRAAGAEIHAWELFGFTLGSETEAPGSFLHSRGGAYVGYVLLLADELCKETRALRGAVADPNTGQMPRRVGTADPLEVACVEAVAHMVELCAAKVCGALIGKYKIPVPENILESGEDVAPEPDTDALLKASGVCEGPLNYLLASLKELRPEVYQRVRGSNPADDTLEAVTAAVVSYRTAKENNTLRKGSTSVAGVDRHPSSCHPLPTVASTSSLPPTVSTAAVAVRSLAKEDAETRARVRAEEALLQQLGDTWEREETHVRPAATQPALPVQAPRASVGVAAQRPSLGLNTYASTSSLAAPSTASSGASPGGALADAFSRLSLAPEQSRPLPAAADVDPVTDLPVLPPTHANYADTDPPVASLLDPATPQRVMRSSAYTAGGAEEPLSLLASPPRAGLRLPEGPLSPALRVQLFRSFDLLSRKRPSTGQDEEIGVSNASALLVPVSPSTPTRYQAHACSTMHSPLTPSLPSKQAFFSPLAATPDSAGELQARLWELPFSLLHVSRTDVADRELAKALLRAVVSVIEAPVGRALFTEPFQNAAERASTTTHTLQAFTTPASILATHIFVSIVAPPSAKDETSVLRPLATDALSNSIIGATSTSTRTQESLATTGSLWTAYPPASLALIEQALIALAPYVHPLLVLDVALTALSLGGMGAEGILSPVGGAGIATFTASLPAKTTFDLAASANDVHIGCGVYVSPATSTATSSRLRCSPRVCINMPIPIKCALKMVAASAASMHALGVSTDNATASAGSILMRTLSAMAVLMRVSVALLSNPNAIVRKEAVQTLVSLESLVSRDIRDTLLAELSAPQLKLFEIYKAKANGVDRNK